MKSKEKKDTIHLPKGTTLTLDGEQYVLESGKVTVRREFLYSVGDDPDDPTETVCHIDVEAERLTPDADG